MASKVYKVVSQNEKGELKADVMDLETLLTKYADRGKHFSGITRAELQGSPLLVDFYGPMYDGQDEKGNAVIRYESWPVFDRLSK